MKKILIVEDESLVAHHLKLILTGAGYQVCCMSDSVEDALIALDKYKPNLVLLDIHLKGNSNGIDLARILTTQGIAFVYLTANFQGRLLEEAKATFPFGFIVKPFREDDLLTTLDVAFYRIQNSADTLNQQEIELSQIIRDIQSRASSLTEKLLELASHFQKYLPFDYFNIIVPKADYSNDGAGFLRVGFDEYQALNWINLARLNRYDSKAIEAIASSFLPLNKPVIFNSADFETMITAQPMAAVIADGYNIESALFFPLHYQGITQAKLEFYNKINNNYSQHQISLLNRLQPMLNLLFSGDSQMGAPNQEILLTTEKRKVSPVAFTDMISLSSPMDSVKTLIATVAPLDTSVIILGESGTGKERVARSIHQLSPRKDKPLVIVNCASLPPSLVESELFGHEKGAFTNAIERRIGKFEMANHGTIFLDEIGELSADLQVKLLRVLQEQEIERIGGRGTVKIDVRIIAATNRNLEEEMESGKFRLDLYYRLYVFPIIVPPLRDRVEDIEVLANYFIERFSSKYNLPVKQLSAEVLEEMMDYSWPGNVRELEHFIERSLLLSRGDHITEVTLPKRMARTQGEAGAVVERMKTINENERDYILDVLKKCNGRIRGINGAAAVMGLPPTTLHSRMKKLGIKYS